MLVSDSRSTNLLCENHHKIRVSLELSENIDARQVVRNEAMTPLNGKKVLESRLWMVNCKKTATQARQNGISA